MAGAIAGAFAAIVGAGMIIVKAFVKAVEAIVRPEFDRIHDQHDSLGLRMTASQVEQDEEWYAEVKQVRLRVTDLADTVYWLQQELKPNHGSSLRDAVDRIEQRLERHLSDEA
jgi:hypothetical protein